MELKDILSKCDHTLLAQTATWDEIKAICDDGMKYGCASVCIPASYVKQAAEYVAGKLPICTVIGFPNGYDTILSGTGDLSSGQQQLLTIARAMLLDPPMLILDEATSSVDIRTEQYIQRSFREMMNGRTSFVIAHRLSTIRNADLILVMNKGDIAEAGTHEELMAEKGLYYSLVQSGITP